MVEACATAGTHYADLTGEVQFAREAIDRFDEPARASGARIVHSCGYDSIPSDLSVLLLHSRVQADGEGELTDVTTVARIRGGVSRRHGRLHARAGRRGAGRPVARPARCAIPTA